MQPVSPQRAVAERHKPGTALSRKERRGPAVLADSASPPFFAPIELLQANGNNGARIGSGQRPKPLSTQLPNPLIDSGKLLLKISFVAPEQESSPAGPRAERKSLPEPVAFSPLARPIIAKQKQPGVGEMKSAAADFHSVAVAAAVKADDRRGAPQPEKSDDTPATATDASAAMPPRPAAAPATAPATAGADPQFQTAMQGLGHARRTLRSHPKPEKKVAEYVKAAVLPEAAQKQRHDRSQHLAVIGTTAQEVAQQKQEAFKPETFKALLKNNLAEIAGKLPQSEAAARRFKQEKPLEAIKQRIGGQVLAVNATQLRAIGGEVGRQVPPPSGVPALEPAPFAAEPTGPRPEPIDPVAAAPKPKADAEISLAAKSRSMDERMAARHLTDQQLAESNEPRFLQSLAAKQQAQQQAAQAPQTYRQAEQKTLGSAQKKAAGAAQGQVGGMVAKRQQTFLAVFQQQNLTELLDKGQQLVVDGQFLIIYDDTKNQVQRILQALSTYVDDTFTRESDEAKKRFERVVEDQLDEIHGLGIKDFFWGPDTEAIEQVFERESGTFKLALSDTLDQIAVEIAQRLNDAVACIAQGQQRAETLFAGLDKDQQRLHGDTFQQFHTQFDNLRAGVDDKQAELARSLAESYQANADSLNETFQKIDAEVSKTWIDKAADFIEEAATAIYRLGELLLSVLARLAGLITDILAHPIRFLENVGSGIKMGFERFVDRFDEYLLTGFFDWLRGSVARTGIQLPASFDGRGLFHLATQLVGLDYATFREIAVDKLGAPVVEALEKGEEWVREGLEKGVELFRIVQKEGLGGLWEHVKALVAEGVGELFAKIKQTILYEAVKKALAYVATLFNPVGAFIQAALALYHGVQFLIDNIGRLEQLVNAFLDSLEAAVKGNVTGIADKVVLALRNSIVLAIDFLAKLLNLGNLVDKARQIIHTIQTPIKRAMGWVIDKFKPLVQRAVRGSQALAAQGKRVVMQGKAAVVQTVGSLAAWLGLSKSFKAQNGETHVISIEEVSGTMELLLASRKNSYERKVEAIQIDSSETAKVAAKSTALGIAKEIDGKLKERKNKTATPEQQKQISRELNGLVGALIKETALILPAEQAAGGPIAAVGDVIRVGARRVVATVAAIRTENGITYLDYASHETEQGSRAVAGTVEMGGSNRTWWRGSLEATVLSDQEFQLYRGYAPERPWNNMRIARAILNYRRSGFQRNSDSRKEWEHKIEQSTGLPQIHSAVNLFWTDADFNRWLGAEVGRANQKEIVEGGATRWVSWREYLNLHGTDEARQELKGKLYRLGGYREVDHQGPNGFWRELAK